VRLVAQLEAKVQSVRQIIRLAEKTPEKKIQALSMALNGVIDAEVNGGVKKYREVSVRMCVGVSLSVFPG
jgi:hypothetical protein